MLEILSLVLGQCRRNDLLYRKELSLNEEADSRYEYQVLENGKRTKSLQNITLSVDDDPDDLRSNYQKKYAHLYEKYGIKTRKKFRKIQVKNTLYNMVCMCDIAYFYKTTMYLYVTCERVSLVPREDLDIYTRIYIIHTSYIYIYPKSSSIKYIYVFIFNIYFILLFQPESNKKRIRHKTS